jgi:hypothetical protein
LLGGLFEAKPGLEHQKPPTLNTAAGHFGSLIDHQSKLRALIGPPAREAHRCGQVPELVFIAMIREHRNSVHGNRSFIGKQKHVPLISVYRIRLSRPAESTQPRRTRSNPSPATIRS